MKYTYIMSNDQLLENTKNLVEKERKLSLEILDHLKEIETRRLHLELGYGSLHEYMVQELKYSDGAAARRIASMRLSRELPQVKQSLVKGEVTLTSAAKLQSFFKIEKCSKSQKQKIFESIKGKSTSETEKILGDLNPKFIPKEKTRIVNSEQTMITFIADQKLSNKLEKLKNLLAHQIHSNSATELIEKLADIALEKLDLYPEKPKVKAKLLPKIKDNHTLEHKKHSQDSQDSQDSKPISLHHPPQQISSRYIPQKLRRGVWQKSKGQCSFISPTTKRRCCSQYALQIEHIKPFAFGGKTEMKNLELLCREHNQHRMKKLFKKRNY